MVNEIDFTYWVEDPLIKVMPEQPTPHIRSVSIDLNTVRNEYESAQIIVKGNQDINDLSVIISSANSEKSSAPIIEYGFLKYLSIKHGTTDMPAEDLVGKAPIEIADPILENKQISIKSGICQPIWFTVYIPKETEPGTYKYNIKIFTDQQKTNIPVSIKVYPYTLTDKRNLHITNWFSTSNIAGSHNIDIWSDDYWTMLDTYAKMMDKYRQNTFITPIFELIEARTDDKGHLVFDFNKFDRWVNVFRNAGLKIIEGGHLGSRSEWESPDFNASMMKITDINGKIIERKSYTVTDEKQREFLSQFLPALQQHLEEKNWLKDYVQHLVDEPIPVNANSYKILSSYVRKYGPKLKIIDASMCKEIAGAIDIWVPQPQEIDSEADFFAMRKKAGDELWFYTCLSPKGKYMNRFIDQQLIKTRLLHWMNYKYGFTGYLHWGYNHWQKDPFTDLEPNWGGNTFLPPGDSHIVYPGKNGPIASIRLAAMRDGIEDFELLSALSKKNKKKADMICDSIIRSMTDYTIDHSTFNKTRLKMIKELSKP